METSALVLPNEPVPQATPGLRPAIRRRGNPNFGKPGCNRRSTFNGCNSALQDALFNDIDPRYSLCKEQAWHRMAIQLAETGARIDEIAAAVGKTRAHVSNVLRQPWARQRMIEEIKQEAQEDFKRLLEAERVRNLQVLTDIRDDPDATKRDKIAAIGMIWDRDMGRPNQPLTTATQITAEQLKNMNDGDILKALVSNGLIDPATVGKNASATADNPPKPANVV